MIRYLARSMQNARQVENQWAYFKNEVKADGMDYFFLENPDVCSSHGWY